MKKGSIKTLCKAARIKRSFVGMVSALIPAAFVNRITPDVIFLIIIGMMIYAACGIQNAKKDDDFVLPWYSDAVVVFLFLIAMILSLQSMILFFSTLLFILLGFIYNFISRYLLFSDTTILSFTHHALPVITSSLLLGIPLKLLLKLSIYIYVTFWFMIPLKDLKDTGDDNCRNYKTLTTCFANGWDITLCFFDVSFAFIPLGYFLFDLSWIFVVSLLILFMLRRGIRKQVMVGNHRIALALMRFLIIFLLSSLIIEKLVEPLLRYALVLFLVFYGYAVYLEESRSDVFKIMGSVVPWLKG